MIVHLWFGLNNLLFVFLKVHVSKDSMVPDHCRAYALSFPQDDDYIKVCEHEHVARCDRCELLPTVFREIQKVVGSIDCSAEERNEMEYEILQAIQSIQSWKAHLLRAINQDAARHEVLENLDTQSVFIVMDWAMKFLPRKFRESQSDWFGKRGIPWHISVAMRRNANDETEMLTFVHAFETCNQDSSTVLSIVDDVFGQLKEIMPEVNSVYLRADNAGCYHCASTLLSAFQVATKHEIELKRFDFSDPQGGKGSCDRKAATIKSHMRIHLNSGHDIETASQMRTAIESSGGIAGVSVTVSGPQPTTKSTPVKWEGVSFINNIAYTNESLHVWRAYGIGSGKFLSWSNFCQQSGGPLPQLNNCEKSSSSEVPFQTVKARRQAKRRPVLAKAYPKGNDSDEESCDREGDLFFCPEEGCVKSFQQCSSLEKHLDCDKHKYALEYETLYDKAMTMYATKLEHGACVLPESADEGVRTSVEDDGSALPMGWALKSAGVTRKNLTVAQKKYLTGVFQEGERTGQKADPTSVSKAMRKAKQSDGSSIFGKSDYLTPLQIAGFFSRLSAKKTYSMDLPGQEEELEMHEIETEKAIEEIANEVTETFALQHPIMYEKYNICEIVCQSKLSKFTIGTLQKICTALDLDITSVTGKRKQPYMAIIEDVVARCACKTSTNDQ